MIKYKRDATYYFSNIDDEETDTVATEMVEAFDPQLGAWADVSSMSVDRSQHAVAVVDGKIYALGGMNGSFEALDSVEVFDPQADSWHQVASMPHRRRCHAAATMGGKIYVSGGTVANSKTGLFTRTVLVYDPEANAWAELTSMGTVRRSHTSAAIGGKLYVFGGQQAHARIASVEAYDPISNTWAHVSDLRCVREDFVAVAL